MLQEWNEYRYRSVFSGLKRSRFIDQIWQEVYGNEYPAEAEPFGFVTLTDLQWLADALGLAPGDLLLDVGCGSGGPGLWVARSAKSRLVGIDLLPEAIESAISLKVRFPSAPPSDFSVGSFTESGLASSSVDAVMSVDAFWMVLNKPAALAEMLRVMRPYGRFALTTWAPLDVDMTSLFSSAQMHVEQIDEAQDWKSLQLAAYRQILRRKRELSQHLGEEAARTLIAEATRAPKELSQSRRLRILASSASRSRT